jgi:predicted aldo/keto reductase-like oxidoreductase
MNRRDLLKGILGAGAAAGLGAWRVLGQANRANGDDGKPAPDGAAPVGSGTGGAAIAKRALGKTGFEATILGFGGYPISEVGDKEALGAIHVMVEAGVNYFDTASTYGPHKSEKYLSQVLPTLKRESFFLTTKTLQRRKADAEKEIAESLKSLKLQPDLLQIHAVNDLAALDAVFAKGGSFEAALAAKESGKVRFLGITGHTRPEAVL